MHILFYSILRVHLASRVIYPRLHSPRTLGLTYTIFRSPIQLQARSISFAALTFTGIFCVYPYSTAPTINRSCKRPLSVGFSSVSRANRLLTNPRLLHSITPSPKFRTTSTNSCADSGLRKRSLPPRPFDSAPTRNSASGTSSQCGASRRDGTSFDYYFGRLCFLLGHRTSRLFACYSNCSDVSRQITTSRVSIQISYANTKI